MMSLVAVKKRVGITPRINDRGLKLNGGPRRQRFMGRSRLYTMNKAIHFLKDLAAGDVHVATALGNSPRPDARRRKPALSIAYLANSEGRRQ
ncbi:MAG: hypothetical protein KGL39_03215 [Patescibacteria group bacterium]|nr:hypothetical protein [Patescibacteria group bacterium]